MGRASVSTCCTHLEERRIGSNEAGSVLCVLYRSQAGCTCHVSVKQCTVPVLFAYLLPVDRFFEACIIPVYLSFYSPSFLGFLFILIVTQPSSIYYIIVMSSIDDKTMHCNLPTMHQSSHTPEDGSAVPRAIQRAGLLLLIKPISMLGVHVFLHCCVFLTSVMTNLTFRVSVFGFHIFSAGSIFQDHQ